MDNIRVMMVDDEPLIRKVVKQEMNSRAATVESGDVDGSVMRRVEMVETFADGPSLTASLGTLPPPDYLLVDMEFQGEPTGGLAITRRVHERFPDVKIIIFSGRFDNPMPGEEGRLQRVHEIGRVVMEAMELGIKFRTTQANAAKLAAPKRHTIECRSAQQGDDPVAGTLTEDNVKHTFVIVPKTMTGGTIAPASPVDGSGTYSVLYWKETVNGKVTKELDPVNFKCVIDGVDYLANTRKILGY